MSHDRCQDSLHRLHEYLDGELTPADAEAVRQHLDICQQCYPHLRLAEQLRDCLNRAAQGQPPCPDHLRDKIKTLIQQERTTP